MRGYLLAAAGAASFLSPAFGAPMAAASTAAPAPSATAASPVAPAWWYVGEAGAAPDRQLFFADRNSLTRRGDAASIRAVMAFEQPQDGIKAFEVTYEFRCTKRQKRTREALFTQADGSVAGDQRPAEAWVTAAPGSATATLLDAACGGTFPAEAHAIARAPLAEAQRVFAMGAPPAQVAAASPGATAPRPGGLMSRDALVQCLRGTPSPDTPACREARASAARGRAAAPAARPTPPRGSASTGPSASSGQQSYAQLLDSIVAEDSKGWRGNLYEPGSMRIVDVRRDARGNVTAIRGNYRFGVNPAVTARLRGTILDPSLWSGITTPSPEAGQGWVEVHFVNGRFECMQYHDRSDCITSTRDYYQRGNEAARERHEYCAITRNC